MKRRQFLEFTFTHAAAAALGLTSLSSAVQAGSVRHVADSSIGRGLDEGRAFGRLASAYAAGDSQHPDFRLMLPDGETLELPGRGHDLSRSHNGSTLVSFARRPGRWMLVVAQQPDGRFDLQQQIDSEPQRHFMGHGVFSADDSLLFVTEHAADASEPATSGVIGVYETAGFRRIGEFQSAGVGPHQIVRLPSSSQAGAGTELLCIANGGFESDPEFPRMVLNESGIDSSLAFIEYRLDDSSTRVLASYTLPEACSSLSIRHLAAIDSLSVCFGCQDQDELMSVELIQSGLAGRLVGTASLRPDLQPGIVLLPAFEAAKGYVGSVVYDQASGRVLTSSPRGNSVALWDPLQPSAEPVIHRIADACGICTSDSTPGHFAVSTGYGELWQVPVNGAEPLKLGVEASRHFDNHLLPA